MPSQSTALLAYCYRWFFSSGVVPLMLLLALMLVGCIKGSPDGSGRINTVEPAPLKAQSASLDDSPEVASLTNFFSEYMVARHAERVADFRTAAEVMYRLWQQKPDNPQIAYAAFKNSLLAGRFAETEEIAIHIRAHRLRASRSNDQNDLSLFLAIKELQRGAYIQAIREIDQHLIDTGVAHYVKPIVQAWARAGQQEYDRAIDLLQNASRDSPVKNVYLLNQVYILAHQRDYKRAAEELNRLMGLLAETPSRLKVLYARFLYLSDGAIGAKSYTRTLMPGRVRNALEVSLRPGGGFSEQQLPYTNTVHGFVEGINDLSQLLREEIPHVGLQFSQIVLMLTPNNSQAALIAAEVLSELERYQEAIMKLRLLASPSNPLYFDAVVLLANAEYQRGNSVATERVMRQAIAHFPDESELYFELGQIYQLDERYDESSRAFTKAIDKRAETHPRDPSWSYYYFRGIAYEQSDRWSLAEADFLRALEIDADNPYVLNYLGYSWIEQHQNINRALKMLQTAVRQQPNNAYIIDSYGWVLYRLGRYEEAVSFLEQAVLREPSEAVINDHLGDVYWQLGRKREAEYQWQHALSLDIEDPERRQKIEDKLNGHTTPEK